MYVDNTNLNKVVETILGMHQINLLWLMQVNTNIKSLSIN
jgi:hypothetical protein